MLYDGADGAVGIVPIVILPIVGILGGDGGVETLMFGMLNVGTDGSSMLSKLIPPTSTGFHVNVPGWKFCRL
jgi:hypothetical protein